MNDLQEAKDKCFHYANEQGVEALVPYLWLRIERLETELAEVRRTATNASIDARWPSGNFGGHGF